MNLNEKSIAKSWTFRSSSNPDKLYETLQYTDGSTSCQCKGWTRQVKGDGSRSCTHTRMIENGLADSRCINKLDYTISKPKKRIIETAGDLLLRPQPPEEEKPKAKNRVRKIIW
jgi:hypothetical protein